MVTCKKQGFRSAVPLIQSHLPFSSSSSLFLPIQNPLLPQYTYIFICFFGAPLCSLSVLVLHPSSFSTLLLSFRCGSIFSSGRHSLPFLSFATFCPSPSLSLSSSFCLFFLHPINPFPLLLSSRLISVRLALPMETTMNVIKK